MQWKVCKYVTQHWIEIEIISYDWAPEATALQSLQSPTQSKKSHYKHHVSSSSAWWHRSLAPAGGAQADLSNKHWVVRRVAAAGPGHYTALLPAWGEGSGRAGSGDQLPGSYLARGA